jgi:hypothetical protein
MSETKFQTHTEAHAKMIVLYILIFMFLYSRREDKASGLNGSKHYPNMNHILKSNLVTEFILKE